MWGVSAGRLEPVRTCRATRLEVRVRIAATVAAIFLVVTVDSLISADTPDVRAVPYASRFGGSAYDTITDVAVDNHGNVYLTGSTRSADFPLREPFQSAIGGDEGKSTAFVAKISPSGNLIFSTYFGGSGSDSGNQIAVDGDRAVFVAGGTTSPNLPTTTGVIQPAPACPNEVPWCRDAFLMKLTPAGRLVTATYFGHGSTDVTGLAVDAGGDIYLAGTARERLDQSGRPVPSHVRGGYHAFIAKLSGDATTYRYVAHIGPSATSTVSALGVDRRGRAYIGGKDSSCRVQATPGAFTTPDGCLFVARLASEEGSVEWLSRFGGTDVIQLDPDLEETRITDLAVDGESAVYMTGVTGSRNFPTTPGAAQRTLRLSGSGAPYRNVDGFVAKLFADGSRLLYSTYLGGSDADYASSIAVDESGAVYVAGTTESADLAGRAYTISRAPALLCCWDTFAASVNEDGSAVTGLTVLGGSFSDLASAVALGTRRDAWLVGSTFSPEFPTTSDALDRTARENADGIVVRLPPIVRATSSRAW
jgi:hypothetical protein